LSSSFGVEKEHAARKQHRCEWCGETIEPGERYAYFAGYNDDFYAYKMHLECRDAERREWREYPGCEYEGFESYVRKRGMTYNQTDRARKAEREGSN